MDNYKNLRHASNKQNLFAVHTQKMFIAKCHLLFALLRTATPIRVINKGIERLIDPLPKNYSRHGFIECHHPPGDQHVAGDLGGHSADQVHFFARVRVEGGIVEDFRPPEFLAC